MNPPMVLMVVTEPFGGESDFGPPWAAHGKNMLRGLGSGKRAFRGADAVLHAEASGPFWVGPFRSTVQKSWFLIRAPCDYQQTLWIPMVSKWCRISSIHRCPSWLVWSRKMGGDSWFTWRFLPSPSFLFFQKGHFWLQSLSNPFLLVREMRKSFSWGSQIPLLTDRCRFFFEGGRGAILPAGFESKLDTKSKS